MKKRLDLFLVDKGFCKTRSKALDLIKRGEVSVNNVVITKASTEVADTTEIKILHPLLYVSRGGLKLEHALTHWNINVQNKTAVDIGSSTGGFTDCLLQNGAKKVFAVDVGTNQLDPSLRENPQVELYEQTDVRNFSLPEKVDIAVIDVSFISLEKIFPTVVQLLYEEGAMIALVKPQFEVGKEFINKQGLVTSENAKEVAYKRVLDTAQKLGFVPHEIIESPIVGGTGNKEFLLYATLKQNKV